MFYHHKFIFFPVVLIVLGILALLTNLGIITTSVWSWWPLLLIIFGIWLIVWQNKRKRLIKGILWYGAIHSFMKSGKVDKLLKNKKVQEELKKIVDIIEGVVTDQIEKLYKKYGEQKESQEEPIAEGKNEEL